MSPDEIERYARHIVLPEIGGPGQRKLGQARVLVVGAGGLGAPCLLYLAAAGVGTLGIVDHDRVSLSNLQRQVIHRTGDVGRLKVESAAETVRQANPHVAVEAHAVRLDARNALDLVGRYDLVVEDGRPNPTYRCLFPDPPPEGLLPSCAEAGILGALTGVMGTLQALEVVKEIVGFGESLVGRLLLYDARSARFETLRYGWSPENPLSGLNPTIRDLSRHGPAEVAAE